MANRPPTSRADRIARAATIAAALLFLPALGFAVMWQPGLERWIGRDVAGIGGPFALTDQEGEPFTRDDLLGHPHVVYFGFTFCPDVCPTTLFQLGNIVAGLGEEGRALKVAFISVDPERDTVPVLKEYVAAFHDDFVGLTGSPDAISEAASAYQVYYRKVVLSTGGYTIDHTASAFLFNADGTYAGAIAYDETDDSAREKIRRLIEANP